MVPVEVRVVGGGRGHTICRDYALLCFLLLCAYQCGGARFFLFGSGRSVYRCGCLDPRWGVGRSVVFFFSSLFGWPEW